MKLIELIKFLETIADPKLQESYDNSGLIYGNPDMEIESVLCSLDCTVEILQEAKEKKCNVVVSHHPIVFTGIKKFDHLNYVDKAVIYAIKNDIAIYAIHTNLDNVLSNGVNEKIAQRLGLSDLKILSPKPQSENTGAGITGYLKEEMKCVDLLDLVKKQMKTTIIKHTRFLKATVKKIAVAGGSGVFLIKEAIRSGSDVFITADIKYHDFFDTNDQILLMDIGHFESEQFTIDLLHELISENFRNFATHYSKTSTNPVLYY